MSSTSPTSARKTPPLSERKEEGSHNREPTTIFEGEQQEEEEVEQYFDNPYLPNGQGSASPDEVDVVGLTMDGDAPGGRRRQNVKDKLKSDRAFRTSGGVHLLSGDTGSGRGGRSEAHHLYNVEPEEAVPWHRTELVPSSSSKGSRGSGGKEKNLIGLNSYSTFMVQQQAMILQLEKEKKLEALYSRQQEAGSPGEELATAAVTADGDVYSRDYLASVVEERAGQTRDSLAERCRTQMLVERKEAATKVHLDERDSEMVEGRSKVAQQIADLKMELAAQIHHRDERIRLIEAERDGLKQRLGETEQKLRGALTTLSQETERGERDVNDLIEKLALVHDDNRALKGRILMLDDQRSEMKHRAGLAEGQQSSFERDLKASAAQVDRFRMQAARAEGNSSELSNRIRFLEGELNRVKTELHRAVRSLTVAEKRADVKDLETPQLLQRRVNELEDEVLRVQRNNSRILGLLTGLARVDTAKATHDAIQFLKFVNAKYTFVLPSLRTDLISTGHRSGDGKALPKSTPQVKQLETILDEFNVQTATSALNLRSANNLTTRLREFQLQLAEMNNNYDSAHLMPDHSKPWIGERDHWIPSEAYQMISEFRRKFLMTTSGGGGFLATKNGEDDAIYETLLQGLWSLMRKSSFPAMSYHQNGGSGTKDEGYQISGPEARRVVSSRVQKGPVLLNTPTTTTENPSHHKKEMVEREVADVLKDGAVLEAVQALTSLKAIIKAFNPPMQSVPLLGPGFPISQTRLNEQLRLVERTIHSLVARVETLGAETKHLLQGDNRAEAELQKKSSTLSSQIKVNLETRLSEFLMIVEQWVARACKCNAGSETSSTPRVDGQKKISWAQVCSELEASRNSVTGLRRESYRVRDDLIKILQ